MRQSGWKWGPTGSTGFELATGVFTVNKSSDLDLLIEVPVMMSVYEATSLLRAMESIATARIDIQLITPKGSVSMSEYVHSETVLLKTTAGPVLQHTSALWY